MSTASSHNPAPRFSAAATRAVIALGVIACLGAAIGCQSSESDGWAQTAPLIQPVERPTSDRQGEDMYLGAWAEMTAARSEEPRASADDADAARFSN